MLVIARDGHLPVTRGDRLDPLTQERIARNDALFRDANEKLRDAAVDYGVGEGAAPFICECADPRCTEVVLLELPAYAEIRSSPRWFLNIPGHEVAESAGVVARRDGYLIVEKLGHAGEVAERLAEDPTEGE